MAVDCLLECPARNCRAANRLGSDERGTVRSMNSVHSPEPSQACWRCRQAEKRVGERDWDRNSRTRLVIESRMGDREQDGRSRAVWKIESSMEDRELDGSSRAGWEIENRVGDREQGGSSRVGWESESIVGDREQAGSSRTRLEIELGVPSPSLNFTLIALPDQQR